MTAAAVSALAPPAGIRIQGFTAELQESVRAFNGRLALQGVHFRFPDSPVSPWLPKVEGRRIYQEYFLAVDEEGSVRGAYILKHQDFMVHGQRRSLAFFHLPLSEGLIDRRYGAVGLQLLSDALKRQPEMFVLGIGSLHEPLSRMLLAMRWRLHAVPFYFRILRPARVARRLAYLRTSRVRRALLDCAAITGSMWLGVKVVTAMRAERTGGNILTAVAARFGSWADAVWQQCEGRYAMIGARDWSTLEILYPSTDPRFIRLMIAESGVVIGWAVVLDTQMRDDKYFGNLRVGSIIDCLSTPEKSSAIVGAAVQHLRERGVDLIVSNQLAACWCDSLKRAGFLAGPSGFLFGSSAKLTGLLRSEAALASAHLNRGDGDGPINL